MKYETLYNQILSLPYNKAVRLVKKYNEEIGFKTFAEQQRALDRLSLKGNLLRKLKENVLEEATILIHLVSSLDKNIGKEAFEMLKQYPFLIWVEIISTLNDEKIIKILEKYSKELPSIITETLIINSSEKSQLDLIKKYSKIINPDSNTFQVLYFSVSEESRKLLESLYPEKELYDVLLELEDYNLEEMYKEKYKDEISKVDIDELIKFILLKATTSKEVLKVLQTFQDRISHLSSELFELLILRYRYFRGGYISAKEGSDELSDIELLHFFKEKFESFGLEKTLLLFNSLNEELVEEIIYIFLSSAYNSPVIKKYTNENLIASLTNRFVTYCNQKDYTIEAFYNLVDNFDNNEKLIHDNYIEALLCCGKLMKSNKITDKDAHFIKLRDMFIKNTYERVEKDGTLNEVVNLNGLFYRLIKGSLDFNVFYNTKTYRGIIYLSKSGNDVKEADYITSFINDKTVNNLDIKPLLRWKKEMSDIKEKHEEYKLYYSPISKELLKERIGLQLLVFFGKEKAKYLLDANIKDTLMENLFDRLDYSQIEIDEEGKPIINNELITFLFGRGSQKEPNSTINKMLRGEINYFRDYFAEFCNTFNKVAKDCNNILSVNRIVRYFLSSKYPITLKPNELEYINALRELKTMNEDTLNTAVELCNKSRNRVYSTIPKVSGKVGDLTYEILDYKNPLMVASGYLSHCCFTINGISYSALIHSMTSNNARAFYIYHKGEFIAQSWVWRNGDIVCFDSVEAGGINGELRRKLSNDVLNVYKKAAKEILEISKETETDVQRIKAVTIGGSDFNFSWDLEHISEQPKPLEDNVYVYDSRNQAILAGSMPEDPRYGAVSVKYLEPRDEIIYIDLIKNNDLNTIDKIICKINSIRYLVKNILDSIELSNYAKAIIGEDWYILFNKDGNIEYEILNKDTRAQEEFDEVVKKYNINLNPEEKVEYDLPDLSLLKKLNN